MKKLVVMIVFLFIGINTQAQGIEIPENLKLENAEDYKKTEALVLKSIKWITETPLSEKKAKRKEINAFLIKWMTGTPSVSIEISQGITPMECSECLMLFMSGWTKYSLENNYSKNKEECALQAVETTIAFYQKNKSELGKNADLEKLIKRKKKGKLRKYVKSKI